MDRNRIKIICNPQTSALSYQFQNEQMAWVPISQSSDLAVKYTETSIRQSAPAILNIINTVYNPGNRGVDIFFEGPDKDYAYLCKIVNERFSQENISCGKQTIKVAVAGKIGAGKTTLIEALAQTQGVQYTVVPQTGYRHYKSKSNTMEWFELEGIDFGMENLKMAEHTIDILSKQGLTMLLHCLSSDRVEQAEVEFIQRVRKKYPEISLLGIFTNAVSTDDTTAAEKVSRVLEIRVLPIMAKEQNTRGGVIKAFGHENVLRAILGGS